MIALTDHVKFQLETRHLEKAYVDHIRVWNYNEMFPNSYRATSRNGGNTYFVDIEELENGNLAITCSCEAGFPSNPDRLPILCKHAAAAWADYKLKLEAKSIAEAAEDAPVAKCQCGNEMDKQARYCESCIRKMHSELFG